MQDVAGNIRILFHHKYYRPASLGITFLLTSLLVFLSNVQVDAQCKVTATMTRSAASVCLNEASPVITFTGAKGTAPYIFSYKLNNGVEQTISTVAGNAVNLPVPTSVAGTFTYEFTNVIDNNDCSKSQSGIITVTVNPLPAASVSGGTTVCQGTSSPSAVFAGTNGSPPYTFTYSINGGTAKTVTSPGSSANVAVPTGTAGLFTYALSSVKDGNGCTQAQSAQATFIINPSSSLTLSSPAASSLQNICLGSSINPITYAIGGTGTGATLTGSLPSGVAGSYADGVFTISGTPSGTGTFNYTVTTTGPCANIALNGSIRVNNIVPGAITTNQPPICSGGDPAIITSSTDATGPGTISYQWQKSTIDCDNGFTDIGGATSASYNPPRACLLLRITTGWLLLTWLVDPVRQTVIV